MLKGAKESPLHANTHLCKGDFNQKQNSTWLKTVIWGHWLGGAFAVRLRGTWKVEGYEALGQEKHQEEINTNRMKREPLPWRDFLTHSFKNNFTLSFFPQRFSDLDHSLKPWLHVTILLLFWVFWPQGMWNLSSLTRNCISTLCIGRPNLNHWTSQEVPQCSGAS